MPKPNRGKTETIKDRAVYVYLPSLEMVENWRRRAEKAGVSISKFVVERVEDSIRREEGEEGYLSRAELVRRLRGDEEERIILKIHIPILKQMFGKKKVKRRILAIESDIRRARGIATELDLGSDIEIGLDNARADLTDLLAGKKLGFKLKTGKHVDAILNRLEDTVKTLLAAIEKGDKKRASIQISMLKVQIGDLRTEFRR